MTFQPGLESLAARLAAKAKGKGAGKKKSEAEAVWDAYTRRREEKRAQAARLGRPAPDSDDDSEPEAEGSGSDDEALPEGVADDPFFARPEGEDPFDDPFFNSEPGEHPGAAGEAKKSKPAAKKGKARRGDAGDAAPEAAARKAELEMLLLDEQSLLNQRAPAGELRGEGFACVWGFFWGGHARLHGRRSLPPPRPRRGRDCFHVDPRLGCGRETDGGSKPCNSVAHPIPPRCRCRRRGACQETVQKGADAVEKGGAAR